MTVLIFPGSSPHNTSMITDAQKKYDNVIALEWNHWDGDEDREDDYRRVVETLQSNPNSTVFAKSYGGAMVMQAFTEYLIAITDITILGALPAAYETKRIDVNMVDDKVHIIQNEFDPHGSYTKVAAVFSNVVCVKGNTSHDYIIPDTVHTH
jgi:hypothetical protein